MAPPFNQNAFQRTRLKIEDLKSLSDIILSLESDHSLSGQITTIEIDEQEIDESELDADGDPPEIAPEVYERMGSEMSKILSEIQQHGGVETFKWAVVDQKNIRPEIFWQSLWKTATTLKNLDLDFSVHELRELAKLSLPQVEFPVLETLRIDAAAAHGDDGLLVEKLLHSSPAVRDLDLSLPSCDLEGCRLQGLTWQYTFPSLQTLELMTYNSDSTALSEFLLRHPKITTLVCNVDTDDGFIFPEGSLPELGAISMNFRSDVLKANVEALARCPHLVHLRVDRCPNSSYLELARLGSLKCLELEPGVYSWRDGFEPESDSDDERAATTLEAETGQRNVPGVIGKMLEKMKGLQELAVDMETGGTYFHDDAGKFVNVRSMDVEDLKSVISVLPKDTQIRALRLSDDRGLKLSDEVLENFPDVPASLEYLKWDMGKNRFLYRIERSGEGVKAVECAALRASSGRETWVEQRVLEY